MHPAKTRISLGIHPVWSESSLCAHWVAKDPSFLHTDSKDSDQTGRMLIWAFAGHTVILLVLSWGGSNTVNPPYNVSVGPQWFMTLKWICRYNDFLWFRPRDEKTQKKCAAISTWFAMSESLISNLDKLAETCCQTNFRIKFFDKYMYLFLRNNSAKAKF